MFKQIVVGVDEHQGGRDAIALAKQLLALSGHRERPKLLHPQVGRPRRGSGQLCCSAVARLRAVFLGRPVRRWWPGQGIAIHLARRAHRKRLERNNERNNPWREPLGERGSDPLAVSTWPSGTELPAAVFFTAADAAPTPGAALSCASSSRSSSRRPPDLDLSSRRPMNASPSIVSRTTSPVRYERVHPSAGNPA